MSAAERIRIDRYEPTAIEPRWQQRWAELGLHDTDLADTTKPKFYLLTMYPYPSGNLHIGHWYVKTPTDAIARFHRMHGENVFMPIGFDAFGLPAENAAIKNKIHPREWTLKQHRQHAAPAAVDGRHLRLEAEVVTCEPDYYRWNQWLFLRFLEAGLAYRASSPVDWCPNDGTLAREQVEGTDRHCWRCGARVEKRELDQWYLRITKYADELLDFSGIEWPEPIRIMQTNWIGRCEGAEVVFTTAPDDNQPGGDRLRVFTTRPDTLYGATFMVLAPEHALVAKLTHPDRRPRWRPTSRLPDARPRSSGCRPSARRPASSPARTRPTRSTASASRSGSPTTSWPATAPARSWPCPPTTSATSSSPRKFGLPIRRVIAGPEVSDAEVETPLEAAYIAHGEADRMVNSAAHSGKPAKQGFADIVAMLETRGPGQGLGQLPPARLADQPPALLGHADPGRLLRQGRHRARAGRPAAGSAAGRRRLRRPRREPAQVG